MKRFLLLGLLIFLYSCGGGGGSGSTSLPPQNTPDTGGGGTIGGAASITLTSNPSSLTVKGTSSITATVLDSSGANVPDGTKVYFTLSDSSLGTITSQATTYNGNAIATFTASNTPGTATIKATSGNVSNTVNITISAAATGSIEFVSATPQVIGIKGSGQTETSTIKFLVKDINGNAVLDGTSVSFTMNGPSGGNPISEGGEYKGGEYIGEIDTSPTTASASTSGGFANVILHSGKVAGPVTIISTVTLNPSLSSASPTISIGGGVASATHFNLATLKFNLPGLAKSGETADITAFIADRFGNYNVLTGTSVSFYTTEGGAIAPSGITDATGLTSVTFRTQSPLPSDVSNASAGDIVSNAYFGGANEPYCTVGGHTYNPRDGWLTVLAAVQGEEAFNDANANGMYDLGELFTNIGEPFIDKNDNGVRDSSNPFEEYIDADGIDSDGDGPNDVWDGPNCPGTGCQTSKMIWTNIKLQFTDIDPVFYPLPNINNCYNCNAFAAGSFAVAPASITKGSIGSFSVIYGDFNLNKLEAGTTVAATATTGDVTVTNVETPLIDRLSTGPSMFSFNVEIEPTELKNITTVSATVTTPQGIISTISTTVLLVAPPLDITSGSILAPGTVGTVYSVTLAATGGTPPYSWSRTAGTLPTGLSLTGSTGTISGTPTAAGTYNFTITVYDSFGWATKTFSITINP